MPKMPSPVRSIDLHRRGGNGPKALDLQRPEAALVRSNARLVLNSVWPPDDACHVALKSMLEFVKEEGHLTWFLKNHYHGLIHRTTYATRISMGTQMGSTIAAALTIPSSDVDVVYALLFAVNEVGKYKNRTYLTQRFPGTMNAHLEIDHVEGSDTVLNKAVMTDLLKKIVQEYKCEVFAAESSQGGNRAHVFTDLRVEQLKLTDFRNKCTEWLKESITKLDSHLVLDDSTGRSRVIRAPFARSPKAYRQDQYAPWLIYSHAKKHVCDASEMNMTIGEWVKKMTMV
ncbi:hypothetical protein T492DRAFT_886103 [Pavlovales sp. CCMP2436]|nr:hypothetical protein T492DRAFT_886103 [Pavlovales sp. CCMP2436]